MSKHSTNGWKQAKLGEFFRIKHGYAFQGEFFKDIGPYVLLTPGNFYDEGGFKLKGDKEKYYTGKVPPDFILKQGDLLLAMTEQAEGLLGSPAIIPESNHYLHNQRLGLITDLKENELDRKFLYYLFNTRDVRAQIRASASGVKVRHTSPSRIYEVKVTLPPLPVQRKIGQVLSAYDDLIENNTRRIKLLEQMAHALYREWFVRPCQSDKLPKGWEEKPIGEVIETLGGGTPSTKTPEFWDGGDVIWFTPSDLTAAGTMFVADSGKKITRAGLDGSSARIFPAYSVMMTSRATIGVVAINTKEACTNQGFITCIPNERVSAYQLYFWMEENKGKIISIASGATYKEISRSEFRELTITVPPLEVAKRFVEMVQPVGKLIENLQSKNANLRHTRDLLLPKLISGEVDVENIEVAI